MHLTIVAIKLYVQVVKFHKRPLTINTNIVDANSRLVLSADNAFSNSSILIVHIT